MILLLVIVILIFVLIVKDLRNNISGGKPENSRQIQELWRRGAPSECGRLIELMKKFVRNPIPYLYKNDDQFYYHERTGGCKTTGGARADMHAQKIYDDIIKYKKPKRYLDVGCSDGTITTALADLFGVVADAVDVHQGVEYKNINYKKINGTTLPFKNDTFDVITCNMVMHHIADAQSMLVEIERVLRHGGYFYLKEHDCWNDADAKLIDIEHSAYAYQGEPGDFTVHHYLRAGDWKTRTKLNLKDEGIFYTGERPAYTATRAVWLIFQKS